MLETGARGEITQQSYGAFSLALHQRLRRQGTPSNVTIELTRRCPLACAHCYNNLPMDDTAARQGELTQPDLSRIFDELADMGCLWLLLTGGEILARKDFIEIYAGAKRRGFIITLFTNGTLITPRIADYWAEWRPFSIEITLYGRTRETYEALTGVPGSYDRCLRGIHLLKERSLPVKLKTVAVTINKHEIWDMKRFAEEELGLPFKFDALMSPRIDCSQSPLAVRLSPEEVVALDLGDPQRVREWQEFAAQFNGPVNPPERSDDVYHCGGGQGSFAIDPEGRMSICVLSHRDTYDLKAGSVRDGWEQFLTPVRRKKQTIKTKCTRCHIKAMCGMCPANGELENGDPERPVEFLCHTAHLRALAFDIQVPEHGVCEYCDGGMYHESIVEAAGSLRSGQALEAPPLTPKATLLPMLATAASAGAGCGSGGCSSCH